MKKNQSVALRPSSPRHLSALSLAVRQGVYATCQLTRQQEDHIENMLSESGARNVGKGALNNVITRFMSKKNAAIRMVESHTCERTFAYELELDPDVLGYQTQVRCPQMVRVNEEGRKHVSAPHLDFLVFHHDRIELVECKPRSWLEAHGTKRPEWTENEQGEWSNTVYRDWAREHGLTFRLWTPPEPVAIYLRNLELIYALWGTTLSPPEASAARRTLAALNQRSYCLEDLRQTIPGFRERVAAWLLAHGNAHGLTRSVSMDYPDHFRLYQSRDQARMVDEMAFGVFAKGLNASAITDSLTLASPTDLTRGRERLKRVRAMQNGEEPPARRMLELAKRVDAAVANGIPPIVPCLTNYVKSGNRNTRLLPKQLLALDEAIRLNWNGGICSSPTQLHHFLMDICEREKVNAPVLATLTRRLKQQDPAIRALHVGGMRAYQASRANSDPRKRSQHSLGYGHTLHIDSSDIDHRSAPNITYKLPAEKPTFYLGIDDATRKVMAHALYFGNAQSDGFAMLIREYVHRHGHLPHAIFVDRGPENISDWLKNFCFEHGISLSSSPTAGSRFNSEAETVIKQVNQAVAHQFPGTTKPDAMGRAVDGRFKSRQNARIDFTVIHEAFLNYIYLLHPCRPSSEGTTPNELMEESLARFGMMGSPQAYDEGFRIQTSIPINVPRSASEKRGIRSKYGSFTSDELRQALRTHVPQEVRRDCVDPTLLHVLVKGIWYRALHARVLSVAQLSDPEKIYFGAIWDERRRVATIRRQELDREQHRYNQKMRTLAANSHLQDFQSEAAADGVSKECPISDEVDVDPSTLAPPAFDEE